MVIVFWIKLFLLLFGCFYVFISKLLILIFSLVSKSIDLGTEEGRFQLVFQRL
jgi:hypothetical protein